MNNQISLRIHSVKCIDETGGKWAEKVGNDEISLSGFGIDSNAATIKVNPFEVYAHFDDGDVKNFRPVRKFITLNLNNGASFPQKCSVGFLLAERDGGDLGTKTGQIFTKVKEEVDKKKKEEEEKKKRALSVTGPVNLTGAEIAVIWTVVKPFIYNWIKDKIISAANDDIFPLVDTTITVPSNTFSWNGSKVSPPYALTFRGHDGIYAMTYDWELS